MVALAEGCPLMASLDLTACGRVEDEAVRAAARGMLLLGRLSVSLCDRLTAASLAALADWAEALTTLEMLGCGGIGPRESARFRERVEGRMQVCTPSPAACCCVSTVPAPSFSPAKIDVQMLGLHKHPGLSVSHLNWRNGFSAPQMMS